MTEEKNNCDHSDEFEYEQLLQSCKAQYSDVPGCLMEHVIKDYLQRPEYYDELYKNKVTLLNVKKRDTQDDINLLNHYNKNECEIGKDYLSFVGEHDNR